MRYQNAAELLPAELLEALQGYLDGGYLYIPRQEDFSRLASTFLGWDVAQAVEQVDISQY